MEFKNIKKILFFRLCCIGDVVMLTPVINNLHRQFPDAEIKIAASEWIIRILPYLPVITEAIIFDEPFKKGFLKRLAGTIKFIFNLRREKFDMVYLAHRNFVYGSIMMLSGIRYRLGFSGTKFLTHPALYDESLHYSDRYTSILEKNGINVTDNKLKLLQKKNKEEIFQRNSISAGTFIIGIFPFGGINPGTSMNIKRWDFENYLSLINILAEKKPHTRVILFEGTLVEEKKGNISLPENVIKAAIDPDVISICNIFISADTGPLYIAEAFSVSTLSIFGPTDADLGAPKSTSEKVIHKHIWKRPICSPCHTPVTAIRRNDPKFWNGNTFICYTGTHECMKSISVGEVYSRLDEMIEELSKK